MSKTPNVKAIRVVSSQMKISEGLKEVDEFVTIGGLNCVKNKETELLSELSMHHFINKIEDLSTMSNRTYYDGHATACNGYLMQIEEAVKHAKSFNDNFGL